MRFIYAVFLSLSISDNVLSFNSMAKVSSEAKSALIVAASFSAPARSFCLRAGVLNESRNALKTMVSPTSYQSMLFALSGFPLFLALLTQGANSLFVLCVNESLRVVTGQQS